MHLTKPLQKSIVYRMLWNHMRREGGMEGDGVLRLWKLENPPVLILSCNSNILIRFEENIK